MRQNKLEIQASLAAMQALLSSTSASAEDIVNTAIEIGRVFARQYETAKTVELRDEFEPEIDQTFYFPVKFRSGYVVDSDVWKGTRSQLSLKQLKLCFNDEFECIDVCKHLNAAYP